MRRHHSLAPAPFREVNRWLERYRRFWSPPPDALATELARGRRVADRGAELPATAAGTRVAARRAGT